MSGDDIADRWWLNTRPAAELAGDIREEQALAALERCRRNAERAAGYLSTDHRAQGQLAKLLGRIRSAIVHIEGRKL